MEEGDYYWSQTGSLEGFITKEGIALGKVSPIMENRSE